MIDAGIGRLLVASLHEAIGELLPSRVEFYEGWLSPEGLRGGRIGLAPLSAVLSFLRQEGEIYGPVVGRAGELAAGWRLRDLSAVRHSAAAGGPTWLRGRVAMGIGEGLVRRTFRDSGVRSTWRAGEGRMTLAHSVFCHVREPGRHARCGFYEAALRVLFADVGLASTVLTESCRATGAPACVLAVHPETT